MQSGGELKETGCRVEDTAGTNYSQFVCYFSLEGPTDTTEPEIYLTVRRKQGEKSSGGYEKSHGQSRLGIMNSLILTRNVQYYGIEQII